MRAITAGRTGVARIIGAVVIMLLAGSEAFGQFVIQPMKVVIPVPPGRRAPIELWLENTTNNTTQDVDFRLVDVAQDPNGVWQAIEPDAVVVDGPNGSKLVSVGNDLSPNNVDISKLRSCQSWLRLPQATAGEAFTMKVLPTHRVPIQLFIDVPSGARGYYCAALMAQALIGNQEIQGRTATVVLEFLVPIIVEVEGRPERQNIEVSDIGLKFRPQDDAGPAATLATLSVRNNGGTYSMIKGYVRVWGKLAGHWRKLVDKEFASDVSIIPGAEFTMKTDVGIPLGKGDYKVQGYLFVDGAQGSDITKELAFDGDPRVRGTRGTAALDMDKREVIIGTRPGQTRTETVLLVNASEEGVTVDLTLGLPDHMVDRVAGDVRGEQFDCSQWVEVSPAQFTLEPRGRINLRVVSKMPADASNANYYAMIGLRAKYTDGTDAGLTDCRICVQNANGTGNLLIQGLPVRLAEVSPGRYAVTAQFGNYGNVHLQPTCKAMLTSVATSEQIKKFNLGNDMLSASGLMLPLEMRSFSGVLDVSGVAPGLYRLTALLTTDKGETFQKQIGLEVTATADGKAVKANESIQPVPIKL